MKSKPKPRKMLYMKLSSLDDLCRYVCNFDYTNSAIMSIRGDSGYRIFAMGEESGEVSIAYYINSTKMERLISYTYPASMHQQENSHFTEQIGAAQAHYMGIISIAAADFRQAKDKETGPSMLIQLSSAYDIVNAAIKGAVGGNFIPNIYAFGYKNKRILCAFDLIGELSPGDDKILYYSVLGENESGSFARYKYAENKVDFTEYMGEHSYMYAKIIHLAEPFPFFKMPD